MVLLPATIANLDIILHHRREMFREMGGEYERTIPLFDGASRDYFEQALKDGSYYGVLGEIEGKIVAGGGVVIARWPGSPMNSDPKRAWILNVYVDPGYRRRGFGRTMMQSLIDWCRENGFRTVALHSSEEGRPLYEELGFRSTNEMRLRL